MEKKTLARFEDVLEFYPTTEVHQQKNALNYILAQEIRKNKSLGARKISEIIKIPEGTVNNWLGNRKIPRPIKGLKKLESMKLLPLEVSESKAFTHFVRTLGLRYSDGCIYEQKRNNSYTFYVCFKDKIDALKFIEDSRDAWNIRLNFEFSPQANAYYVYLPSSLARLVLAVGSVKGNKTRQPFDLPEWVLSLSDSLKCEFLSGLFCGDGDSPRLKTSGRAAESLRLSLSSERSVAEEFSNNFMKKICFLLSNVGIQSTLPKIMINTPRVSKKGVITYPIVIRILTERENMIKFLEKVKYTYCNRGNMARENVLEKLRRVK